MTTTLTDAELARLEELAGNANKGPFSFDGNNQVFRGDDVPFAFAYAVGFPTDDNQPANCEYIAAACNAAPSLVAEVRRLRERVEALEWLREVEAYDVFYDHPAHRKGRDLTDVERQACIRARAGYRLIEKAAREDIS